MKVSDSVNGGPVPAAEPAGDDVAELERMIDRALSSVDGAPDVVTADAVGRVLARADGLRDGPFAVGVELLPYRAVAVLTDAEGRRLADDQRALRSMAVDRVVADLAALVRDLVGEHLGDRLRSARVGLGLHLAGPVDATKSGTVLFFGKNPPDRGPERPAFVWRNVPLGQLLRDATGLPTALENDANALAIYQQWFGVGREVSGFGLILLRDGVGGSLVVNDRLFDGPFEIGNLVVYPEGGRVCDCGNQGCLEVTAGGYGITETARIFADRDIDTAVQAAQLVEESTETGLKALDAFRAAGIAIAKGLGFVVTLVAPPRMVLYAAPFMVEPGTPAADAFLEEARKFKRYVSHEAFRDCELVIATLQPYEGAHAAALVALERCFDILPACAARAT